MKDKQGNGLAYVGDQSVEYGEAAHWSRYLMWMDHRVVFEVWIDNDDVNLHVWITVPGGLPGVDGEGCFNTKRSAVKDLHSYYKDETKTEVKVVEHISSATLQMGVYGHLPFILADLYVPRAT